MDERDKTIEILEGCLAEACDEADMWEWEGRAKATARAYRLGIIQTNEAAVGVGGLSPTDFVDLLLSKMEDGYYQPDPPF